MPRRKPARSSVTWSTWGESRPASSHSSRKTSRVPAGTTDILVSYTYRISFQDSGQNFGLAAAISTVIFVLVALLSMANLKLLRVNQQEGR